MKKITPSFKKRIVATIAVSALMSGMLINASASSGLVTLSSSGYIDADNGTEVTRVFDAADLTALNTAGGALSSSVTSLNSSVNSVSSSVSTMSTQLGGMETDITSLQNQIYGAGGTPAAPTDGSLADKVNDLTGYGLGDATAGEILSGKKAWVNGNLVTGSMNDHHGAFNVTVGNEAGSFVHADDATKDTSNNFTGVTAQVPFTGDNSGYYNGTMTLDASSIASDYYQEGLGDAEFRFSSSRPDTVNGWHNFHGKTLLRSNVTTTEHIYMGSENDEHFADAVTAIGGLPTLCLNMGYEDWSQLKDCDYEINGTKYGTGNFYYVCGTGSAQDSVSGSGMNAAAGYASFTPPALNYNNDTGSISIVPGKLTAQAWLNGYGSGPSTTTEVPTSVYLLK